MPIAACPQATFTGEVTLSFPIDITSSSWTRNQAGTATSEIRLPRSCYDNESCAEIYPTPRATEVLSEQDNVCVITETTSYEAKELSDEIVIGTNSFVDLVGREVQFCVEGEVLQLKALDDNPYAFVHTFERE